MALSIGRKGWIGVGLQSSFQTPVSPSDYVYFTDNTLHGVQEQIKVDHAAGIREGVLSTVAGKRFGEGEIGGYLDSKNFGYFAVGALGSVAVTGLGGSVYQHTITRNTSNTPQYLCIVNDRVTDRQQYADVTVDELTVTVKDDLASYKAKLSSSFPQTTTSGTQTTASGNVFTFRNGAFAFGSTVAAAQSATNLKPHDFTLKIMNNTEVVHRHGSPDPGTIANKQVEYEVEFNLYFENTTDRDAYYNQSKQAASYTFDGNGIGNGYQERVQFNFYQTSIDTFELETGINDFYAEKVKLQPEYDTANSKAIDIVLRNTKSLYI